ncbi:ribosome biogenesis protein SLX9 homolog [Cylas formicarius]|uniref:ribosome biogenesis protein SLX9 homolog n=1 Tax=Cylas formicarius TaxID=197179 RepID=UPI0029588E9D|nr:ribosome biogenesis protein SLX9 homolog [Cylas formicarius]
MGKVRRLRRKSNISSRSGSNPENWHSVSTDQGSLKLTLSQPFQNAFDVGLENINNNKSSNDVHSVKLFKLITTESSRKSILPKRQKLKLRRQMLLKKIDNFKQVKKQANLRKKKNNVILGDLNSLHDALPALEPLLKDNRKYTAHRARKQRAVKKAKHRQTELIRGVKLFKQILGNEVFQKNPLGTISQHIQVMVKKEREMVKN